MKTLNKIIFFCLLAGNLFAGSCKKSGSHTAGPEVTPPVVYDFAKGADSAQKALNTQYWSIEENIITRITMAIKGLTIGGMHMRLMCWWMGTTGQNLPLI
jgi:hypothetical protein